MLCGKICFLSKTIFSQNPNNCPHLLPPENKKMFRGKAGEDYFVNSGKILLCQKLLNSNGKYVTFLTVFSQIRKILKKKMFFFVGKKIFFIEKDVVISY